MVVKKNKIILQEKDTFFFKVVSAHMLILNSVDVEYSPKKGARYLPQLLERLFLMTNIKGITE